MTKWCGIKKKPSKPPQSTETPLADRTKEVPVGCPKSKKEGIPVKKERNAVLSMWPDRSFCSKLLWEKVLVL